MDLLLSSYLNLIGVCLALASLSIRPRVRLSHPEQYLRVAIAKTRHQLVIHRRKEVLFFVACLFVVASASLSLIPKLTDTAFGWSTSATVDALIVMFFPLIFYLNIRSIAEQSSFIQQLQILAAEAIEQEGSEEFSQKALNTLEYIDREVLVTVVDLLHSIVTKLRSSAV